MLYNYDDGDGDDDDVVSSVDALFGTGTLPAGVGSPRGLKGDLVETGVVGRGVSGGVLVGVSDGLSLTSSSAGRSFPS